jgi:lysophospholipase L1-like esterase
MSSKVDHKAESFSWLEHKKIAFVGDSVTADLRSNYVTLTMNGLAEQIDASSLTVINSGVDSSSAVEALDRAPELLIEDDPDVIVVFLGINDSKIFRSIDRPLITSDLFTESYRSLLDCLDHNRLRRKVLVTPPPLLFDEILSGDFLKDYWYWTPSSYLEYVVAIRELANRPDSALADVYSAFERHKGRNRLFGEDGVNPNIYGHRIIAASVLDALASFGSA